MFTVKALFCLVLAYFVYTQDNFLVTFLGEFFRLLILVALIAYAIVCVICKLKKVSTKDFFKGMFSKKSDEKEKPYDQPSPKNVIVAEPIQQEELQQVEDDVQKPESIDERNEQLDGLFETIFQDCENVQQKKLSHRARAHAKAEREIKEEES